MKIENLKALVYGRELTPYQRKLAQNEFLHIIEEHKLLISMLNNEQFDNIEKSIDEKFNKLF